MFDNLKNAMSLKKISIRTVARLIGTTEKTVSNKLDGRTEFTLSEILAINENLFPEYELRFLFKRDASA